MVRITNRGKELEIYFSDLNEEAKKELLKFMAIKDEKEENWDVFSLAVIPKGE
jgi:hypothetical protein